MANFQQSLKWLQKGKAVKRSGWDSYILKIKSLPNFCSRIHLPSTRENWTEIPARKEDFNFIMIDMLAGEWELTDELEGNIQSSSFNLFGMH